MSFVQINAQANQFKDRINACKNILLGAPELADTWPAEINGLLQALDAADEASMEIISKKYKQAVQMHERLLVLRDLQLEIFQTPAAGTWEEKLSSAQPPVTHTAGNSDDLACLRRDHARTLEELTIARDQLKAYENELIARDDIIATLNLEVILTEKRFLHTHRLKLFFSWLHSNPKRLCCC